MTQQKAVFSENKTIFVSGLSTKVSESELFKIVDDELKTKSVAAVNINRDTRRYETAIAYINMNSHEDAKEAINKLNGRIIDGKKINMSWSLKDYKEIRQNDSNLVIKGIKKDIDQLELQKIFSAFGETMSVKLSTNEKNESNGFGYVRYVEVEQAEKALAASEDIKKKIGEESFEICKFVSQPGVAKTNLYVANIDKSITNEQFVKYFETFGKIREDNGRKLFSFTFVEKYGKNRGFINFENPEDAEKALKSPKENVLGEGELVIAYFKTKQERKREWANKSNEIKTMIQTKYKEFNLYVNSKQPVISIGEIEEKLKECGQIFSLKIKYIEKQPTGIFYLCFDNAESTQKAMEKCKILGWDCNKMISRTERINSQYPYGMMGGNMYSYPMNYFQYMLSMFPQMYYMTNRTQNRQKGRIDQSKGKKPSKANKENAEQSKAKNHNKPKEQEKKIEVTEDMKNELGDKLYDYILNLGFDEELTGRITGVLLESLEFVDLKNKMENNTEELKNIINEVKQTLESMQE